MRDGVQRMVEEHYADVLAYCRRHTASAEEAADACQETFLRFVRRADAYRERGKPLAYLLTIARNVCLDLGRSHARDAAELPEGLVSSAPAPDARDLDLALALERLPPASRELIELRYGQGLRVGEVARVCGISRFAAGRRIRAALDALRRELSEGGAGTDTGAYTGTGTDHDTEGSGS